ncbi:MAG: 4-(cytidine 5'-diphospho)-2-C-methyl-D-erythritol kinase [Eubacteriales Family XIII. Incertae Sedis bacterium]|nr:MAG: 4-(cytidine 5'-diphospho)-2-C-methyl-D-erythritol kinase [Clostridiales Family XIII bacterium]
MKKINIKAYAKINLSLDVLGLKDDGFHNVSMVMQQIELHDEVLVRFITRSELEAAAGIRSADHLSKEDEGNGVYSNMYSKKAMNTHEIAVELSTNKPYLPRDARNIAYRAAQLMSEKYGMREDLAGGKVRIDIKKNIPVGAGLAGGSSNGAAVLHALNKLWKLRLSVCELMELGAELGSDVPFCVMGQARVNRSLNTYIRQDKMACCAALAEGTGTRLEPVTALKSDIVLVKPMFGVSTREVYKMIDEEIEFAEKRCELKRPNNGELVAALANGSRRKIIANMINVLELYTLKAYPEVKKIKETMFKETKAAAVMMSGSGPTVLGVYFDKSEAERAYQFLKPLSKEVYLTRTMR